MSKEIRNTLLMTLFALVFGLVLGVVHEITAGPIEAQKEKALKEAYQAVIPDADEFNDIGVTPEGAAEVLAGGDYNADITSVLEAVDDDMAVGYVINVVSHGGYGGDIAFSMGVDEAGSILGISITSIAETPGLGMRAQSDPEWLPQFYGNEPGTTFTLGENVDSITSATFTSRCITRGVNAGLAYVDYVLGGGEIK
ncbi:MAG: RnfABCDGE type electron transport complex subunit G [Lachnospiraceae bacterium]|nr:RnfABCDGE type electron transport complex subunit G [Lachnospiraceae bacterium]